MTFVEFAGAHGLAAPAFHLVQSYVEIDGMGIANSPTRVRFHAEFDLEGATNGGEDLVVALGADKSQVHVSYRLLCEDSLWDGSTGDRETILVVYSEELLHNLS